MGRRPTEIVHLEAIGAGHEMDTSIHTVSVIWYLQKWEWHAIQLILLVILCLHCLFLGYRYPVEWTRRQAVRKMVTRENRQSTMITKAGDNLSRASL